jgi:hypothetical protein
MRVLIISLPRTGSTSLMLKYSEEYKLGVYFEPFEPSNLKITPNSGNIVVKTLINHNPLTHENIIEGYIELSKTFDKVILLSRRDLKQCSESWAYLKHNNFNNFDSLKHYVWKTPPDVEKHSKDIIKWDVELKQLSKLLEIPITYYEDIFDENSNDRYRKNIDDNSKTII